MKTLLEAGASSQAEIEQAQTALSTTEAQLKATEAQLREQRVELGYHTVSAPTAGVVGDIPVRVGDRVTRSTLLTTIDENAGLELYINVPVQEAAQLKVGLPVHLVDDRGEVLATERAHVRLALGRRRHAVGAGEGDARERGGLPHRAVRARARRLDGDAGAHRAGRRREPRQRPVLRLRRRGRRRRRDGRPPARGRARGRWSATTTSCKSGLKPGEKLIVSGVQKIGDGAPVTVPPPGPAGPARRRRRPARAVALFSDVFIRRPILATVCSLIIILAGAISIPPLPIARYPELTPPSVTVTAFYTGANAQAVESAVTTPLEQVINGVEGMTYIRPRAPTAASRRSPSPSRSAATPTWPPSTCRTASTRRSAACRPTCAPTASP